MAAALYVEDVLLVDRCLTGEPAATRELFRRHRNRVHASLFRVLGSNRDMDDLLQESFLQVFQSLRGWRAEASLATWIDRVAVRCAYRYLSQRARRVQADPLGDEDAAALTSPDEGPGAQRQLARDGVLRLYAVLDQLTPAARLAFTLHEIDGRSLAETAALVGSSVTATKLRVWRARNRVVAAAATDPVLGEFLQPAAGGDLIQLDERKRVAAGPDGTAVGAEGPPRGIDGRKRAPVGPDGAGIGAAGPDGTAVGDERPPRGIDGRKRAPMGPDGAAGPGAPRSGDGPDNDAGETR